MNKLQLLLLLTVPCYTLALIPFLDGGNDMPQLYNCFFNEQIAKQAKTAVGKAVSAGIRNIEVNFPPVPNVDEVRFGTPLNKKFGTTVVARDIGFVGGYKPGSDISRQLVAYSNVYWAKQIAPALSPFANGVAVLSAEPVNAKLVKQSGVAQLGLINSQSVSTDSAKAVILVSPGGEEQWDRLKNTYCKNDKTPLVILNNSYSTTYNLGNQRPNYEEIYYLKRISKGWVYRAYPGPWKAYLEKPDGKVELLQSYKVKPSLKDVSALVRDESFKRYAINNDRWSPGFGERL